MRCNYKLIIDWKYSRKEGLRCRDWSRRLMSSVISLRKRMLGHRAINEAFAYAGSEDVIKSRDAARQLVPMFRKYFELIINL